MIKPEDFITLSPQYTHGGEKNSPINEWFHKKTDKPYYLKPDKSFSLKW
jgi:hypothetical protein